MPKPKPQKTNTEKSPKSLKITIGKKEQELLLLLAEKDLVNQQLQEDRAFLYGWGYYGLNVTHVNYLLISPAVFIYMGYLFNTYQNPLYLLAELVIASNFLSYTDIFSKKMKIQASEAAHQKALDGLSLEIDNLNQEILTIKQQLAELTAPKKQDVKKTDQSPGRKDQKEAPRPSDSKISVTTSFSEPARAVHFKIPGINEFFKTAQNTLANICKIASINPASDKLSPDQVKIVKQYIKKGLQALNNALEIAPAAATHGDYTRYFNRLNQLQTALSYSDTIYKSNKQFRWLFAESSSSSEDQDLEIPKKKEVKKRPTPAQPPKKSVTPPMQKRSDRSPSASPAVVDHQEHSDLQPGILTLAGRTGMTFFPSPTETTAEVAQASREEIDQLRQRLDTFLDMLNEAHVDIEGVECEIAAIASQLEQAEQSYASTQPEPAFQSDTNYSLSGEM